MTVILSAFDRFAALVVALYRHIDATRRKHRRPQLGGTWTELLNAHYLGACGECAVSNYTGQPWPSADPRVLDYDGDVGPYQVRTTQWPNGALPIRRRDNDAAVFVLVTGTAPRLVLRGWAYGHSAKQDRYWSNRGHGLAYFVPQRDLMPMEFLP